MCRMSNVRLSTGSPTLERERVERQPEPSRPPVRRNLFGSGEHRGTGEQPAALAGRMELAGRMQDAEKAFIERWNYDISNDRPLSPGNCQWEAVESSEVPPFYSRPPHRRGCPRRGDRGSLNGNGEQQHHHHRSRAVNVTGSQLPEDTDSSAVSTGSLAATGSEDTDSSARHPGSSSSPSTGARRRACPGPDSPSPKRPHRSSEEEEEEDGGSDPSAAAGRADSSSREAGGEVSAPPETTPRRPDAS